MIVIGIAGPCASGKGEILSFLRDRGFICLSLSDVIREELLKRKLSEGREVMIELGNELREAEGSGVLASRVLERIRGDRNYAVDSIRHPAEAEVLRGGCERFLLVWVDAPEEKRFERLKRRGRPGDPSTFDQFRRFDSVERTGSSKRGQDLEGVRRLADVEVINDGTIAELHKRAQSILESSLYFARPGWDEYFVSIARVVSSRSNCVKRRVAAVITVDRRIISTGYNGTPRGVRNCNEGGCPRCNSFTEGGAKLEECLCSHAEENAITQAAYHGVSVKGGSLYTTFSPCLMCTKMIINAGIAEVVFAEEYTMSETSLGLLKEGGIQVRRYESN